ncbi:hypothetical protein PCASD_15744 [Puccinia coronata f. sp. avenae]|uniref:Uncharacterized protein n=1 Tax=Puccinia coronata f. sp. avenae TaxID=200324 RepID=A0A2N5U786_9BASI|nr:hypothetical protein PCASD_22145 [Puccinia coronata f. sp. avenae]PLW33595.1 hypothetical protein PCASD_15744 [Puccinia coronata f. sp. avenae]
MQVISLNWTLQDASRFGAVPRPAPGPITLECGHHLTSHRKRSYSKCLQSDLNHPDNQLVEDHPKHASVDAQPRLQARPLPARSTLPNTFFASPLPSSGVPLCSI